MAAMLCHACGAEIEMLEKCGITNPKGKLSHDESICNYGPVTLIDTVDFSYEIFFSLVDSIAPFACLIIAENRLWLHC